MDREILRLAVPAFGALVAEPMFLLADSAMVGHLGEVPLAGLGLASVILQTIIGLMVFLAYSTTPAVARWLGIGDIRRAVAVGIDGLWFALGLGIVLAGAGWAATPGLVAAFGADAGVNAAAATYLGISMAGIPAMLLVFAGTGLLRGLQDTRTPLIVAGGGFAANIVLNYWFIYGLDHGIAGSAVGSVVAQWGMAVVYLVVIGRHARREGASVWPKRAGIMLGATSGGWLFLRTVTMRIAMVLAVYVATGLGSPQLAAFQVAMTIFATLAFALDALAIAAQALVGRSLGAGDVASVKAILRRCLEWGVLAGVVLGVLLIATSGVLGRVFTNAEEVSSLLPPTLIILGLSVPLGAIVWVLDGVLIGAGDLRYLAIAGVINLAVFVPLAAAVMVAAPPGAAGLAWLMAAFVFGFLGARLVTLGLRARHDRWMIVGAR
ncbi:MATE family efflux transporter [Lysobacter sp. A378]